MRVQVLSDLHFEFDHDGGEMFAREVPIAGDVLVLAGDLLPLREVDKAKRTFAWFCDRFPKVIFVPGNHEYYGTSPVAADAVLAICAAAFPNLHVLNPAVATIEGMRFVGAALWFPPSADEARYRGLVNDFRLIDGFVPWVHETHAAHLAFLEENLRPGDVVITHYLPHPRSVARQFLGSPLNRFFLAQDAAELVERSGAKLWIHGHTHVPCDYTAGATRVVCNPRGYPREATQPIDVGLVIEA